MLLSEITYAILEIIRNGSIVDDDRLDIRLIEAFVKAKRALYVQSLADSSKVIPEHFYQYISITSKTELTGAPTGTKVYKLADMPKVIFSRSGPLISEITSNNTSNLAVPLLDLPYKLVNPHAFKYSGNGRFNSGWIFATYKDDDLIIKSTNTALAGITKFLVKAIVEDPEDISSFNVDSMDYPISSQGFDFIKDAVMSSDIKIFMAAQSDKVNNAAND